jgi:hypothetical protein
MTGNVVILPVIRVEANAERMAEQRQRLNSGHKVVRFDQARYERELRRRISERLCLDN